MALSNELGQVSDNLRDTVINLHSLQAIFKRLLISITFRQWIHTCLIAIILLVSFLGAYTQESQIKKAVFEHIINADNSKYQQNLDSLKSLKEQILNYKNLDDYHKVLKISEEYIELLKGISGGIDPDYIMILEDLATMYSRNGDYLEALEIRMEVVQFQKEALGEKNKDFLTSLANLGVAYSKLGQYQKALEIKLKVVEIGKEIFGEKHPSYLLNLNNLAYTYSDLNEDQKALEISLKIIELGNQVFSEKDPDYLTCKSNLASIYLRLGDYQKAFDISLDVWEIRKEVLGERHPDYFQSMSFLERLYYGIGDFDTSYDACRFNVRWTKEILGDNHPDYLVRLNNLSLTEFRLMKYDSAEYHFSEMLLRTQKMVFKNISLMTETQRALYWRTIKNYFYPFPMFLEKRLKIHPEGTIDAYNYTLFAKGLLLNTSIDFNQLIAEKGSAEAKAKFDELKSLRLRIQKLNEKPIDERFLNVDSLENVAQQKETGLVKISKEYGDYTRNLKINWKDVQAKLEEKDVAIEFVEYPTLTDTVKYAALVLRKGWSYPKMISLFRKDQIEELIKQDKNKVYANGYVGKQIKKLIWNPLEDFISPGERVYFSPAGIYHQLAIENLAVNDSATLADQYQMYRLSSTKELVTKSIRTKHKSAALYGGLQYDLDSVKMVAESKKYHTGENLLAFRGYSNDTTVRKGWEYLGGTLQEVEQINRMMNDKQYLVAEFTGEKGNEESFKALSGKSPEIIHIATHGFFLPIEDSRKNQFMQMRMGDQRESGSGVDPMLRSGLMLAGGNKAWQGEEVPETIEDGVLTAREISRMDLRGTDLVVLSACETGLGEVSSEGVFGLQRSFKQAGVKNLIMSLWEVSDQATSFMMTEFYANLLSGDDLKTAFVAAKQKCKQKFPEPQYWAAFVLLN